MSVRSYTDGVLTEFWDDAARTYTTWSPAGVQTFTRPYTAAEIADANAQAQQLLRDANRVTVAGRLLTVDMVAMQAILDATNAALAASPGPALKDCARAVRRIIRKLESVLDGVD